ncbi:uncharacterized protein EAF02_004671 [Botrytis sinoallii]|uniref:uncharacterized protein n=1 Tax=Botrytis sinoallii TaxID=1463999 RepID=UPI0019001521|nr:uncharacterized protein EAF02_004671 [Botrytis sinoallii]KAF7884335.1 hypothetical protein EAF02_004671 [Botrytis sinoallii]
MSAIDSTQESTALSFQDKQQLRRKESFLDRCPKLPKDHNLLNQILTIALICIQSNPIEDRHINKFITFLGIIYLPRLIKERDNDPLPPHEVWMYRCVQYYSECVPSITSSCRQMLESHSGSESDLEFKGFLEKNCQFLLELCRKPAESIPAPVPTPSLTPRTNLELQLVLVDRALEAESKVHVSKKVEGKMEDKVKGEVLGKLSELAGSIKSVIEVVANGGSNIASNGSNCLDQPSKKRKGAPK